jgi:hypothetical protein
VLGLFCIPNIQDTQYIYCFSHTPIVYLSEDQTEMSKTHEEPKHLKKLIDIPNDIVKDLKKLAVDADKSLKTYIQDILVDVVEKHRRK